MKRIVILMLCLLPVVGSAQVQEFRDPPQAFRPHARMWIPQAAVDEAELRSQVRDLARAGFGDIELVAFDIERSRGWGPQAAQTQKKVDVSVYGWGTPAWTETMKILLDEAGKNGLTASFTIGPAWPVASPLLSKGAPGVEIQLACDRVDLEGGSYEGGWPQDAFAVVAGCRKDGSADLDFASLKDITAEAIRDGRIVWKAPSEGNWTLFIYRNEPAGEMKGGFYVVDHFSREGTDSILDYYRPVLQDFERAGLLRYMSGLFGDSLEYSSTVDWTPSLPSVFRQLKGYDLIPFLPALHNGVKTGGGGIFGGGVGRDPLDGMGQAVLNDYYSVLTYLFNTNHLQPIQEFLEGYGMNLRYQTAYGKYMEQASTSMHVGIPEGEMMMIRNSFDNIRAQAGAVHMAGRREYNAELQAEQGKNHAQSWQNLLFYTQRSFAAGVNNITLHGYTYSGRFDGPGNESGFVPDVAWPGWESFGRDGFSNNWGSEPLWEMAPLVTGFIARTGYVLKQGVPAVDLAIFRESYWDNESFTDNHDGEVWYRDGGLLQDMGYSYDFVALPNLKIPGVTVSGGRLCPDGPAYKALLVDQSLNTLNEPVNGKKTISLEAAVKILSLARAGLPVVLVGEAPSESAHYGERERGFAGIPRLMAQLKGLPNVREAAGFDDVPQVLAALGVSPDAAYSQLPDAPKFINLHRSGDGIDYYYVYNRGFNANSGIQPGWGYGKEREVPYGAATVNVAFRAEGTPYRLDAWTGRVEAVTDYVREGDRVLIPITLEGNESTLIAFDRTGAFPAAPSPESREPGETLELTRWELAVEAWNPGPEASVSEKETIRVQLDGLKPWTEIPELSGVSGIGRYSTEVKLDKGLGAVLDLGTVNYSWRIYVNGVEVPVSQTNAKVDIGAQLRKGKNRIEVVVATTLNNRIKAMTPPAPQGPAGAPGGMMGLGGRTDDPYGLLGRDGSVLLKTYRAGRRPASSDRAAAEEVEVGFGKVSRNSQAYAVSGATMTQAQENSFGNIFDFLRSRVPGVEVSQTVMAGDVPHIEVRGQRTIDASSQGEPLFLLDGVEYPQIQNIRPEEIHSVQVLKDGAASAYGSRGSNGVIMFKTKVAYEAEQAELARKKAERQARRSRR